MSKNTTNTILADNKSIVNVRFYSFEAELSIWIYASVYLSTRICNLNIKLYKNIKPAICVMYCTVRQNDGGGGSKSLHIQRGGHKKCSPIFNHPQYLTIWTLSIQNNDLLCCLIQYPLKSLLPSLSTNANQKYCTQLNNYLISPCPVHFVSNSSSFGYNLRIFHCLNFLEFSLPNTANGACIMT